MTQESWSTQHESRYFLDGFLIISDRFLILQRYRPKVYFTFKSASCLVVFAKTNSQFQHLFANAN